MNSLPDNAVLLQKLSEVFKGVEERVKNLNLQREKSLDLSGLEMSNFSKACDVLAQMRKLRELYITLDAKERSLIPVFVSQLTHLNGQNLEEDNLEIDESNDSIKPELLSVFKKHGMSR